MNIFFDIGLIIIFATILGYIGKKLKQPLIPIYILAGLIIGPVGFGIITDTETIRTLAEVGIAFLLFMVGLELEFKKLKDVGVASVIGGSIQILIMFFIGMVLAFWLGFAREQIIYLGLIVSFSSTMVVIKLLSDKEELDTLHGRIIIGILLMEDLFAIIALTSLQTINNFTFIFFAAAILKGFGLLVIAFIASKYLFPQIFKIGAKSTEMLFLLSITTCFAFGIISTYFGFSIAIGAFIGGITLANLPYNTEIASRVKSLRDFFSTLFFVSLGMELVLTNISHWIPTLIVLTLLIVVFKPLLITIIWCITGYKRKTALLTGISLAQTSEFSLIIVAQGVILGHVSQDFMSIATILAIITISITTYLIKFDDQIYEKIKNKIKFFEKLNKNKKEVNYINKNSEHTVVLIGYDRIGYSIARTLEKLKKDYLVVDFNPDIIKNLVKEKTPCIYGDFGDIEILEKLKLKHVEMVISTIPTMNANELLINKIKEVNKTATIIVTSLTIDDSLELYKLGADYVIIPHLLGGNHVSILLEDISTNIDKLIETKINHLRELRFRKEIHPYHK
ncbi:MAG: cation:proton antiporter [Nanoarchaeota archaeon]|nr:cation:proton antiporter [Nanoarchaeota archaeon]MBU1030225.1 cation:proton antiporter [Nanoarchaeota archaeon]